MNDCKKADLVLFLNRMKPARINKQKEILIIKDLESTNLKKYMNEINKFSFPREINPLLE